MAEGDGIKPKLNSRGRPLRFPKRAPNAPGRQPSKPGLRLTSEEKAKILTQYTEGLNIMTIARNVHRNHGVVSRFLTNYSSTVRAARMRIEAGSEKLAARILKHANVEESLEVLDRVDALPRKERSKQAMGPSFNLIIGMPGAPALSPPIPAIPPVGVVSALPAASIIDVRSTPPVPELPLSRVSPLPIAD